MKKEEYLLEFQAIADSIVEKYLKAYDDSDLESNEYLNTIQRDFQHELASSGTQIIHKSTMKGIADLKGLINGVQLISFSSVIKLPIVIQ